MVRVGVHVSIAGSIGKAVVRAAALGCDTFQIFSRNPRGWAAKELTSDDAAVFVENLHNSGIYPAVDHMPYLPNLASPQEDLFTKSVSTLTVELVRCGMLQIPYLVTHLGHHQGAGDEIGRERIVAAINSGFSSVENEVMVLLENTAGEKNSLGSTFPEIQSVLDGIKEKHRVGVCLDTCHAFAAGYDFRTEEAIEETLGEFDSLIGLSLLRVVHLNDSFGKNGSGLDRHQHIGMGYIGEAGFRHFLHHQAIRDLPLILETPEDDVRKDPDNLHKVRELGA
ncbi:MAG: deoxyribonuclease IV [Methanomicrobiales archaeon]|nr:deoxyribonuclease IV [Methanomicrobiales archaeon]